MVRLWVCLGVVWLRDRHPRAFWGLQVRVTGHAETAGFHSSAHPYQDFGDGCSCERCELSGAWIPPISMPPSLLRFTNFILHCDGGTNGRRA
eukprot:4704033-Prymnesium_polylepis.1